ncbi:MAG: DUF3908 family protein [Bacillota bacterium]
MSYTFEDFKTEISNREFDEKSKQYQYLLSTLEKYFNPEEILSFYPRNVFNGKQEKELFFFTEKTLIIVKFDKGNKNEYCIRSIPRKLTELSLEIPEYRQTGVKLSLKNGNEDIKLNSIDDSNSNWNDTFIENIQQISKIYTNYGRLNQEG